MPHQAVPRLPGALLTMTGLTDMNRLTSPRALLKLRRMPPLVMQLRLGNMRSRAFGYQGLQATATCFRLLLQQR